MNKYPQLNISDETLAKIMESTRTLNNAVINTTNQFDSAYAQIKEHNHAKLQREEEIHAATLQIAENTQGIKDLVSLVREGNQINQQTFQLIQQLQTIMTAQTRKEGETILREVLNVANQTNEDIDTIQTLIGYGKMLIGLCFPETGL